jgi:hypothetical protein
MTKPYSVAFKQKMVQQLTGKNAVSAALLVDEILPHQPMRQLSPGMACIRAMQEQLPRVLGMRGTSVCLHFLQIRKMVSDLFG